MKVMSAKQQGVRVLNSFLNYLEIGVFCVSNFKVLNFVANKS